MNRVAPSINRQTGFWLKTKIAALFALLLVHALVTYVALVPGYINVDEGIYHWMVHSYSTRGTLELWNGWAEAPAREVGHLFLKVHDGKLFPQYPYLFPLLASPFYHVADLRGLFLLNSAAFVGIALLCIATARRLFQDMDLALNACFILVLATFAWEYSQAAWPHSTALLFSTASFYLVVCSYCSGSDCAADVKAVSKSHITGVTPEEGASHVATAQSEGVLPDLPTGTVVRRRSFRIGRHRQVPASHLLAFAAGILAGLAPGVRLDQFLMLPCLVLPFFFSRPWRPMEAGLVLLGSIPGVLVLAATNMVKFGTFSPFSYGIDPAAPSVPAFELIACVAAPVFVAWLITRTRFDRYRHAHKIYLFLAVVAACLFVMFVTARPGAGPEQLAKNLYVSVVDIRALDPESFVSGTHRTEGGGVVSGGGLRKALLQSMPFLVLLFIPIMKVVRGSKDAAAIAMLLLAPIICLAYYSYAFLELMGGGLSLNARYYLMCLPFVSILTAYALRELHRIWTKSLGAMLAAAIAAACVFFLFTQYLPTTWARMEFLLLVMPLLLACLLLAFMAMGEVVSFRRLSGLQRPLWGLVAATMVWSGLTALSYDYPIHRRWREVHRHYSDQLLHVIPSNSIVFADIASLTPSLILIEKEQVRIGVLGKYTMQNFPTLVDLNLKEGHRVFGFFNHGLWKQLESGPTLSYQLDSVATFPAFDVKELSRTSEGE